jgi:hypothetical protein
MKDLTHVEVKRHVALRSNGGHHQFDHSDSFLGCAASGWLISLKWNLSIDDVYRVLRQQLIVQIWAVSTMQWDP